MAARAEVKDKVVETQVGEHVKLSPETKVTYAPRILKLATKKQHIQYRKGNVVTLRKSISQDVCSKHETRTK
jgi:hypothetical protein